MGLASGRLLSWRLAGQKGGVNSVSAGERCALETSAGNSSLRGYTQCNNYCALARIIFFLLKLMLMLAIPDDFFFFFYFFLQILETLVDGFYGLLLVEWRLFGSKRSSGSRDISNFLTRHHMKNSRC